jgi:serine/threonine-protein kinase
MRSARFVGTVLAGKYRVDRIVGEGSTGVVLAATHLGLDEPVAIKLLSQHAASIPGVLSRFLNEGRAAAQIRSPHIVRVRDVGRLQDGTPYTVMELLEGENLAQILERQGPLAIEDAVDFVLQASDALAEAHDAGIIHRDIKPENLVLTMQRNGLPCVKVLDFGISKLVNDTQDTPTHEILGSPVYMSPEQLASSRSVDGRADVWSLGCTLFELLAAHAPFERPTFIQVRDAIMGTTIPDLLKYRPDAPGELAEVIGKCLYRDREERWQSVRAFAEALSPWATARGLEALNARSHSGASIPPPPASHPLSQRPANLLRSVPPPPSKPIVDEPTITATETEPDGVHTDGTLPRLWTRYVGRRGRRRWMRLIPVALLLAVTFALGLSAILPVRPSAARLPVPEATSEPSAPEATVAAATLSATERSTGSEVTLVPPTSTSTSTSTQTSTQTLAPVANPARVRPAPRPIAASPSPPPTAPSVGPAPASHPRALPGDRK